MLSKSTFCCDDCSHWWTRSSGTHVITCKYPPPPHRHTHSYYYSTCTHSTHDIQKGMCIHTLGGNYAVLQTHMYSVGTNTGQMDRWTQIGTDRYTDGYSHTCWEPVLRRPTDLASSWPLQRALKRLEDNLSLPLSVLPSLPLSLAPSLRLSSLWPLSRQPITLMALFSTLSTPFFLHHRITSSCSVGNIQESRADEPKEMFWETASAAKPNWDQPHTGPKSGKKNYEWMVLSLELQIGFEF